MGWSPISETSKFQAGEKYRLLNYVRAPYNPASVALLKGLFRAKLASQNVQIVEFQHAPPLFDSHTMREGAFPFHVVFIAKGPPDIMLSGIDPRGLMAIAALVVVSAASFYLISSRLEKFVSTAGTEIGRTVDTVSNGLGKTVFNPGVLILAIVGIYLVVKAKG